MTALEQVEQLTQQAVAILLAEREAIDARLAQLGHGDGQIKKRRGRPPLPKALSLAGAVNEQTE